MRRHIAVLATLAMVASLLAALPAAGQDAGGQADTAADPGLASSTSGTGVLPNFDVEGDTLIRLQGGAFDPLDDPLPDPGTIDLVTDLDLLDAAEPHYWLVQVADGRFADATVAIEQAGAQISGALPEATYLIRATLTQRTTIDAATSVRWSGLYQPAWKLPVAAADRPGLLDWLDGVGTATLLVYLFGAEPDPQATVTAIDAVDGAEVVSSTDRVVEVRASADEVPAIAALTAVEWIGVPGRPELHNTEARWVNDTGVRDLQWAIRDDRLTGAGQTAAVADTAVNYIEDINGRAHVAFSDCDPDCELADYTQAQPGITDEDDELIIHDVVHNATDHRKMAAYFDLGDAGVSGRDPSGHGSHVAGSVAGDYEPWGTWGDGGEDGIAPGARLVLQNISTDAGGLVLPGDLYEVFRQAYRPRDPESVPTEWDPEDYANYVPGEDARTHNNSWGAGIPLVDQGRTSRLDAFVWEHEDMVIVFSAGNAGPNPGSISEPATAKNNLTSAASSNGRQPMTSIDSITGFSSHGPTGDLRFGPDIATPGEIVISPKGGSVDEDHYLQGTSMSGPVLTGLATLVREYFWEGYGPADGVGFPTGTRDEADRHNPSAALVKAALINGADRMRGPFTGDDGDTSSLDGQYPSAGQGFGLANLSDSLYFADDPSNNWFVDVWRDDEDAFDPTLGASRTYEVEVAEGEPLEITLSWTDAPTALGAGTPALINDLDLVVTSPGGTTYVGNNFNTRANPGADEHETVSGDLPRDSVNNTEKVRIPEPEEGTWEIQVFAKEVVLGQQGFALAASGFLSEPEGEAFAPGPPMQTSTPGGPAIDDLFVEPVSADTARVTFTTDEPTTAWAEVVLEPDETTEPVRFVDVYNWGDDSVYVELFDTAAPRTSDGYADRPVVSDRHEITLAGMTADETYHVEVFAEDLDGGVTSADAVFTATGNVFQPTAADTAQLFDGADGWQDGAQLYVGQLGATQALGAFMFRLPEDLDLDMITGAAVELTGAHVISSRYGAEPVVTVDLLNDEEADAWGDQDYGDMRDAEARARAFPETTVLRGGQIGHRFSFSCTDLDELLGSLSTVTEDGQRLAPFRVDATHDGGIPSYEFGFNNRSQGPHLRPRLVLFTDEGGDDQTGPCDPDTPEPTVTEVGIADGLEDGSVTVSWRTDVPADSLVLYREQGSGDDWTQVGSRALTTSHHVRIPGLDPDGDYEFAIRSTACNGATTTLDNDGEGWHVFWPEIPTASFWFTGESGDQLNKETGNPTATFTDEEPDGSEIQQIARFVDGDEGDRPFHPDAAFWTGEYSGPIDGTMEIEWWWSTPSPVELLLASEVEITVFADPVDDGSDQPGAIIGRTGDIVGVDLTPSTVRTVTRVDVSGEVDETLQIQIRALWDEMLLHAHYNSGSAPSGFVMEIEQPEGLPDDLARVGPVRPPSAEGSIDLSDVATRTVANDVDRAAGTARSCAAPAVERVWGDDRIETAVEVSQRHHPDGSDVVVISRHDEYADALAGAPLARRYDAPVLLTPTDTLRDDVAAEIDRLGATHAVILGGPAAISDGTEQAILDRPGVDGVERLAGADRFATAAEIAATLGGRHAFLVEGQHAEDHRGWPDAMSVASLASHTQRPILLTLADTIPDATWDALPEHPRVTIVGGPVAVSEAIETTLDAVGFDVDRLWGDDRYGTSHEVARAALAAGMAPGRTWLATGLNWPDALVAGPAVAYERGAFHLAHGEDITRSDEAADWVTTHASRIGRATLTGGPAALSPTVHAQVETAITID